LSFSLTLKLKIPPLPFKISLSHPAKSFLTRNYLVLERILSKLNSYLDTDQLLTATTLRKKKEILFQEVLLLAHSNVKVLS